MAHAVTPIMTSYYTSAMKRFCFALFVVIAWFIHLSVPESDASNNPEFVNPDGKLLVDYCVVDF